MLELITLDPEFHRLFNLLSAHQVMLADEVRVSRFAQAISETVKEGDVVVDLGTGTGILAFLAVKAGARKVYAIEQNKIINIAREIARANGMEDRIIFYHADARRVELPERADVVISETIGHMAVAEDFLHNIIHARKHFMKADGKLIPNAITLCVAPVECRGAYERLEFWDRSHYGLDFSSVVQHCANQVYIHSFQPEELLASPTVLAAINLNEIDRPVINAAIELSITRPGELHGAAGWFVAHLAKGIEIDTSPSINPTHWQQAYFPLWPKQNVAFEDRLLFHATFSCTAIAANWTWHWQSLRRDARITPFVEPANISTIKPANCHV